MTELEEIIQKMMDAGESEEDIKLVIENYESATKESVDAEVVPVKEKAVTTEPAPVTAENKAVDTESASEDISLEQFELMEPAEKRKLNYGDAQRLIRERDRKEKGGIDSFDVSSNDYSKISEEEKLKLQDIARKDLENKYKEEGVLDFNITSDEINKGAEKLLKEKTQPGLLESFAAQTARGFASTLVGYNSSIEMLKLGVSELALTAFDDDYKGTQEERDALYAVNKAYSGSNNLSLAANKFISDLEPSIRQYESDSMVDDIANGDFLQAGERAIGAALESLPSIVAASTGVGGIVALGMGSAGNKFEEERKRDSSQGTGNLISNALITGGIEAGFEVITRGILKKAGILNSQGMKKAAKDLILGGNKEIAKNFGISTVKESGSEMATEITSILADALPRWLGGLDKDVDISKEWKRITEAGIVGSVFSTTATGVGAVKNRNVNAVEAAESILMPQDGKQAVIRSGNKISELFKDRVVADKEGIEILDKAINVEIANIERIKRKNSQALGDMNPKEITAYASNNTKIGKLKSTINKPNQVESIKEIAEQDLKNLTEANNVLFEGSSDRRLRENIEIGSEATSKLGFKEKPKVFQTTEEYLSEVERLGFKRSEADGSEGVFVGKGVVLIDRERASRVGAVTVATHEVLHPVLNALVGDSSTQARIVSEFKKSMTGDQVNYVQGLLDENVEKENQDTEFITYFSDAIIKGDIKYEESVFKKIGNFLQRVFKTKGFKNIDFSKGEDVYKFIREYNRDVEKGKISDATIDKVKSGEAKSKVKVSEVGAIGSQQSSKSAEELSNDLEELIDVEFEMDEGDFESQKSNLELKIRQAKKKESTPAVTVKKPVVKKESSSKEKTTPKKVYNNESLIEVINSKESKPSEKSKAEADLVESFDNMALRAIKYDTRKGDYDRDEVKDYLREFLPRIVKSYKPGEAKFSTWVYNNIAPKAQQTYEKFKKIADKSLDAEAGGVGSVKEMSGDVNTLYGSEKASDLKESTKKMIKATSFGPITDPAKLKAVEEAVDLKDGERPNFKSLNSKNYDKVSEAIFGISGKKTRGNATLKYGKDGSSSEANALQNVFKNNEDVKKFIKTMPDYNVATKETVVNEDGENIDVSRDTYGRSIGINPKVLSIFYEKVDGAVPGISSPNGRSLGKTTQTDVYKLKPEFTGNISSASVTKLQSLIGINKGTLSIPIKGDARTEFGTVLTGLTKMYIDNVINTVGRSKLSTNQAKADLGAGKSSLMFSKSFEINKSLDKNNKNYKKFRKSILGRDMFHGGTDSAYERTRDNVVWFYLGAEMIDAASDWGDQKVYETNSSLLKNHLIIPDPNDVQEWHKHASNKFGGKQQFYAQIIDVLKLPNAEEIISDWMDWVTNNNTEWDLGYNLYENNKVGNVAVVVVGKILNSKLKRIAITTEQTVDSFSVESKAKKLAALKNDRYIIYKPKMKRWFVMELRSDINEVLKEQEIINNIGLEPSSNHNALLDIQFSKKKRAEYESVLKKKRPELKDIPKQVEDLFKWADGLDISENKKPKYKKLALYYTVNGYTIFPEDGYKVEEVVRLSSINKIDPYAFSNPDELINKYTKEVKAKTINPDKVKEFSNKEELGNGIVIYDVLDSKKGQKAVRNVVDSYWGEKANPWCLIARSKGDTLEIFDTRSEAKEHSELLRDYWDTDNIFTYEEGIEKWVVSKVVDPKDLDVMKGAWTEWQKYNQDGNGEGYKIAFQNGKLLSFRDGGEGDPNTLDDDYADNEADTKWWDRFDKPTSGLTIGLGKDKSTGYKITGSIDSEGYTDITGYGEGDFMSKKNNYKIYDADKNIIEAKTFKDGKISSSILISRNYPRGRVTVDRTDNKYVNGELASSVYTVKEGDAQSIKKEIIQTQRPVSSTLKIRETESTGYYDGFKKVTKKTIQLIDSSPSVNTGVSVVEYYRETITNRVSVVSLDKLAELEAIKQSNVQFSKSIEKTAISNNNMLPKSQRLKGEFTNQEVLDRMKFLDDTQNKAELQFSKGLDLDKKFNDIIENKTGIPSFKEFSAIKASLKGEKKGRFNFFIPPSAEDFVGLLYSTLGKGSVGDAQMKWYKKNLIDPYSRAVGQITKDRNNLGSDFKALKKQLKIVPSNLKKKAKGSDFTKEQAVRAYVWYQIGEDVPGLSNVELLELVDIVESDSKLTVFATEIMKLNKGRPYIKPSETWVTGTITTDLLESLNSTGRKQYLELWQQNVDTIFSTKNLNKLEAAFGKSYVVALDDILRRMKTGRNRAYGTDDITGRVTDWINASTAGIMFFNNKSASLQVLSAVNFINFGDNNIIAAGKAFANQKQYWSDYVKLWNSEFLVERRDGLKININEEDIANIAKEKGVRGVLSKLLKLGFTPTQLADSFAIAAGGSTFYRNRLKSLEKGGMNPVAAEKQAMLDFREIAEESQQSSRPDKISSQQAGPLGRIILAFANTPAQYARIIKKAASDIKNGRGDLKTNLSKILYYGVAQNFIFNALQQALFAVSFGDEDEEEESVLEEKSVKIINGMIDGVARGTGIYGAVFTVVKNASIKLWEATQKQNPKYEDVALELLKISPPISSKIQKLRSAGRAASWNMEEIKTKGFSLENPGFLAAGNVVSAATNVPLDRLVKKLNNLKAASDSEVEAYKRIALLVGWSSWQLGINKKEEKEDKTKKTKSSSSVTKKGKVKQRGKISR